MRDMREEIAQKASEWWTNIIAMPKFDNGADGVENMFASALATLNVRDVSAKHLETFKNELYIYIFGRLQSLDTGMSIILDCDYSPDRNLKSIAEHNDIPVSNFPWKTTMWIYNDACIVRYGYGADREYIYESENYWHRKLLDNQKSIEYWSQEEAPNKSKMIQVLEEENIFIKQQIAKYKEEGVN